MPRHSLPAPDHKAQYGKNTRFWTVTVNKELLKKVEEEMYKQGLTKKQAVEKMMSLFIKKPV